MTTPQSIPADRPLRVLVPAALVAVALHGSLLPVAAGYLSPDTGPAVVIKPKPEPLPAEPPEESERREAPSPGYADLTVSAAEFPTSVSPGRAVPLTFDVTNRGDADTGSTLWGDRVYLSADETVDDGDTMLLSVPRMVSLPSRTRYVSGPHLVTVPAAGVVSPRMFVLIVTDDANDIVEGPREDNNVRVLPIEIVNEKEAEEPEALELGRDDAPPRVTVAWVSHDAFQDLLAQKSRTHQPVVQSRAEPSPDAPLEPDPLDAGSTTTSAASPRATPAAASQAAGAVTPLPVSPDGTLPSAPAGATDSPGKQGETTQAPPEVPPEAPPDNATPPEAPPAPPAPAQRQAERPSSAPRSDREADPTALLDSDRVRPGQVLVGPGLEVRTFRPDFSATARGFAVPRNPEAVLTFAPDGSVIAAELTTSTGFANVDSPLLTSLYRWRATGPRLERFDKPFKVKITILLRGE